MPRKGEPAHRAFNPGMPCRSGRLPRSTRAHLGAWLLAFASALLAVPGAAQPASGRDTGPASAPLVTPT